MTTLKTLTTNCGYFWYIYINEVIIVFESFAWDFLNVFESYFLQHTLSLEYSLNIHVFYVYWTFSRQWFTQIIKYLVIFKLFKLNRWIKSYYLSRMYLFSCCKLNKWKFHVIQWMAIIKSITLDFSNRMKYCSLQTCTVSEAVIWYYFHIIHLNKPYTIAMNESPRT